MLAHRRCSCSYLQRDTFKTSDMLPTGLVKHTRGLLHLSGRQEGWGLSPPSAAWRSRAPKRRPVGSRRPSHFLFQIACNFNGSARLLPSLMRKCLGRSLALPIPPERFVGFKSETASLPEPNRTESGYRSDAIFVAANRGPAGINTSA